MPHLNHHLALALLLLPAALAESFTLTAYAPDTRAIHGKPVNASGGRFLVGLDRPSSFCPRLPDLVCPAGTTTTVDDEFTKLRVAAPGGQMIYVAPDGVVSYTAPHSARTPVGATVRGFHRRAPSSCGDADQLRLLDFVSTDGANMEGVYACPDPDPASGAEGPWLLVAAGKRSRALEGGCTLLEALEMRKSEVEIGSWQY